MNSSLRAKKSELNSTRSGKREAAAFATHTPQDADSVRSEAVNRADYSMFALSRDHTKRTSDSWARPTLPPRRFDEPRRASGQARARNPAVLGSLASRGAPRAARQERRGRCTGSCSTRLRAPGFDSAPRLSPPYGAAHEGPRLRALTSRCSRHTGCGRNART